MISLKPFHIVVCSSLVPADTAGLSNIAFCDVWCSVVIVSNPGAEMNVLWNALQASIACFLQRKRKFKERLFILVGNKKVTEICLLQSK